jgi:hypothetical protein
MTPDSRIPLYLNDPGYHALQRWYRKNPITLYTGAGVSSVCRTQAEKKSAPKYGMSGWNDFLRDILSASSKSQPGWYEEFAGIEAKYKNEPWEIADWVSCRIGVEEFKGCVVKLIQGLNNFPKSTRPRPNEGGKSKKYKQLGVPFLNAAPTLKALTAFCVKLTGIVDARKNTYRVSPNPRVRAVVTTNYDPFLEAASSTMFIRPLLKPVGARGSKVGGLHQIPVFHVHGYVRYPERGQGGHERKIESMVDPVITTADYLDAWRLNDAFGFTMGPQVHVLRHYRTLFVGFSFRDVWVNDLLRTLKEERRKYDKTFRHFTLMRRSDIEEKEEGFFDSIGVVPIPLNCYTQIPECLGRLYEEGLKEDYGAGDIVLPLVPRAHGCSAVETGEPANTIQEEQAAKPKRKESFRLSSEQYWEELCACRNCYVRQNRGDDNMAEESGRKGRENVE